MISQNRYVRLALCLVVMSGVLLWPQATWALGDYYDLHRQVVIPFAAEHLEGYIVIGLSACCFHDRIIEIPLQPMYVAAETGAGAVEVTGYAISVRQNNDYQVTVSGQVQVRTPLSNGEYYYSTVRLFETVYYLLSPLHLRTGI